MNKSPSRGRSKSKRAAASQPDEAGTPYFAQKGTRETIESIAIAIILAFLFRGFEAEAFVIPTGSMAATLMGRHVDLTCTQCGYRFAGGASIENGESSSPQENFLPTMVAATCPVCRHTMTLDRATALNAGDPNHESFSGDRILVNKLAYDVGDPQRFDVIVFKYPHNAKQNYIKRLAGLPNETLRIRHGDLYVLPDSELTEQERAQAAEGSLNIDALDFKRFHIVRKPSHKVTALAQLVSDTNHISPTLREAGWPSRWRSWSAEAKPTDQWKVAPEQNEFSISPTGKKPAWLRYQHIIPRSASLDRESDWSLVLEGQKVPDLKDRQGQLISDFYAYNATFPAVNLGPREYDPKRYFDTPKQLEFYHTLPARYRLPIPRSRPIHWVGDLIVEANVTLEQGQGELLLDLVEGGMHFQCAFDVATGKATLSIIGDDGDQPFVDSKGKKEFHPEATTSVRAGGSYRLKFANVDNKLFLWVNGWLVSFNSATTFEREANVRPKWTKADPFDLAPIGIGSAGVPMKVTRLKVFRDIYYVAVSSHTSDSDYTFTDQYFGPNDPNAILEEIFSSPESWEKAEIFEPDGRREVSFHFNEDEFFPLGDNSPASYDGRLWSPGTSVVDRELLIGKALFIYWPHSWNRPIPYTPNIRRMGLIR